MDTKQIIGKTKTLVDEETKGEREQREQLPLHPLIIKRLFLLIIGVLSHIYTFAQRGKVRPDWDLMNDSKEVVSNSDSIIEGILFWIIIFIIQVSHVKN